LGQSRHPRLEDTQAQLGVQQQQLSQIQDSRSRLEHRIGLMEKDADPDWSRNWRAGS